MFENIECEWPLFLLLLLMGAIIEGDHRQAQEYRQQVEKLVLTSDITGLTTVPELYYVPADKVVHLSVCLCVCMYVCVGPGGQVVWVFGLLIHGSWLRVPPLTKPGVVPLSELSLW